VETTKPTITTLSSIKASVTTFLSSLKSTTFILSQPQTAQRLTEPLNRGRNIESAMDDKTTLSDTFAEKNIQESCFWSDEKTYILIILSIIILIAFGIITYLLCSRPKRKSPAKDILVPVVETNSLQNASFIRLRSPSQAYGQFSSRNLVSAAVESDSEYDRMLNIPRQRFSLPNYNRPLPDHPRLDNGREMSSSLHRTANYARIEPKLTPATSDLYLHTRSIPQRPFPHSAPTSPQLRNNEQADPYSSIENFYLRPIN